MTIELRRAAAGALLVVLACLAIYAQTPPAFRAGTDTVAVYVTVRDSDGHLVTNLTRDDFRIFEDGQPREIATFSTDPQPLSVAVMLDTSMSLSSGLPIPNPSSVELRAGVLAFVDGLGPSDRLSVGTFGMEIVVGANLTRDKTEIARVLDEEVWKSPGAPLWQAIRAATSSLSKEPGRRVVLVFTDGRDMGSLPALPGGRSAAERQAIADAVMVYAVFITGSDRNMSADTVRLTESTGGGYAVVPFGANLGVAFQQIADELRHQYLLGFVPVTNDGREHRLQVRTTKAGLSVRARGSYVAEAAP